MAPTKPHFRQQQLRKSLEDLDKDYDDNESDKKRTLEKIKEEASRFLLKRRNLKPSFPSSIGKTFDSRVRI